MLAKRSIKVCSCCDMLGIIILFIILKSNYCKILNVINRSQFVAVRFIQRLADTGCTKKISTSIFLHCMSKFGCSSSNASYYVSQNEVSYLLSSTYIRTLKQQQNFNYLCSKRIHTVKTGNLQCIVQRLSNIRNAYLINRCENCEQMNNGCFYLFTMLNVHINNQNLIYYLKNILKIRMLIQHCSVVCTVQ